MPSLEDDKKNARKMPEAQKDEMRNPDGIYSGASIRVARSDGTFAPVSGIPKKKHRLDR